MSVSLLSAQVAVAEQSGVVQVSAYGAELQTHGILEKALISEAKRNIRAAVIKTSCKATAEKEAAARAAAAQASAQAGSHEASEKLPEPKLETVPEAVPVTEPEAAHEPQRRRARSRPRIAQTVRLHKQRWRS